MPQNKAVQDYISFVNGWVAEGGPFAQVGQAFLDGQNIIVDPDDGSVYRRKGLVASTAVASTATGPNPIDTAVWYNPGGDSDNLVVVKADETLYFYEAGANDLPNNKLAATVDLTTYKADGTTTDATIQAMRVSMVSGKGYLFVAGPYIDSLYLEFDSGTSGVTVNQISWRERDLTGANRGATAADNEPTSYDSDHQYNLENAGWTPEWIADFYDHYNVYPSRALSPWQGVDERVNPATGRTDFSFRPEMFSTREMYGSSEVGRGHFILDAFDTTTTVSDALPTQVAEVELTATNVTGTGPYTYDITAKIKFNSVPAGLTTFTIDGAYDNNEDVIDTYVNGGFLKTYVNASHTLGTYIGESGGLYQYNISGNIATSVTSDPGTTVSAGVIATFVTGNSFESAGTYTSGTANNTTVGVVENRRFDSLGFFASRLWAAGCEPETRKALAGRVYYTQLLQEEYHIGRCYTVNDPTAKDLNEVLDTDGGYVEIPEMGVVQAIHSKQNSLVVIANNGVWEISGGSEGYFTPTNYSVRRVSRFGMPFKGGSQLVDTTILYWSEEGIKQVGESEITALTANTDVSGQRIRSFTEEAFEEDSVSSTYDPTEGIVYWSFDKGNVTQVLAFNLRIGAYYRWEFSNNNGTKIRALLVGERDVDGSGNRIDDNLYFITHDSNSYDFAQLTGTDYIDSAVGDVADADDSAYIETRNDLGGSAARPKQAPKLYTYMERGTGSSCYAQGKYEFASTGDSGKWNNKQQAYRDRGAGYDVALSRLTQRGWGRSFRVRWTSVAGAPMRIYGYSLVYTSPTEV